MDSQLSRQPEDTGPAEQSHVGRFQGQGAEMSYGAASWHWHVTTKPWKISFFQMKIVSGWLSHLITLWLMDQVFFLFWKLSLVFDPDLLLPDPGTSLFLGGVSRPLRQQGWAILSEKPYSSSQQLWTNSPKTSSTTGQLASVCMSICHQAQSALGNQRRLQRGGDIWGISKLILYEQYWY